MSSPDTPSPLASLMQQASATSSVPTSSSQVSAPSSSQRLPSFNGRVFLEDSSYPVSRPLLRAYRSLFKFSSRSISFYAAGQDGIFSGDCNPSEVPEGTVLYVVREAIIVHLMVDGNLKRVVTLPSEWNTNVRTFCAALAKAYGGSFEPVNVEHENMRLSQFARSESAVR